MLLELDPKAILYLLTTSIAVQFLIFLLSLVTWRKQTRELNALSAKICSTINQGAYQKNPDQQEQQINYQNLLNELKSSLPAAISEQTNQALFEIESKILKKLARLEPALVEKGLDADLEDIIRSMEQFEKIITESTAESVNQMLKEKLKQPKEASKELLAA